MARQGFTTSEEGATGVREEGAKRTSTKYRLGRSRLWLLGVPGMAILIGIAGFLITTDQPGKPNLPTPTLGGLQGLELPCPVFIVALMYM